MYGQKFRGRLTNGRKEKQSSRSLSTCLVQVVQGSVWDDKTYNIKSFFSLAIFHSLPSRFFSAHSSNVRSNVSAPTSKQCKSTSWSGCNWCTSSQTYLWTKEGWRRGSSVGQRHSVGWHSEGLRTHWRNWRYNGQKAVEGKCWPWKSHQAPQATACEQGPSCGANCKSE